MSLEFGDEVGAENINLGITNISTASKIMVLDQIT